MRSRALLTALMGWLFLAAIAPMPAGAQATPEQLNRLSLDALTAPPPAAPRSYSRPSGASRGSAYAYRVRSPSYRTRSYRRPSARSRSYRPRSTRRSYAPSRRTRSFHTTSRPRSSNRRRR